MKKLLVILTIMAVSATVNAQDRLTNSFSSITFVDTIKAADTGAAKVVCDTVYSKALQVPSNLKRMYLYWQVSHTWLPKQATPQIDTNFAVDTIRIYLQTSPDGFNWRSPFLSATDSLFVILDSLNQNSGRDTTASATTRLVGGSAYTSILQDTVGVTMGNWIRIKACYGRQIAAAHPLLLGNIYQKRLNVFIHNVLN